MASRLKFALSLALGLAAALQVGHAGVQQRFTKQDADRCEGKIGRITMFGIAPRARAIAGGSVGQTTQLTDTELNSYLRYTLKKQVPVGIVEPPLSALGEGRVKGTVVVDLDAVRTQKNRSWTDPLGYMTG